MKDSNAGGIFFKRKIFRGGAQASRARRREREPRANPSAPPTLEFYIFIDPIYIGDMSLYDETVQFVDAAFHGKKPHFERTAYWIEQFIPDASEAYKIAAYAHDIERGVKGEKDRDYLNRDILTRHQEEGAEIMARFLKEKGADENMIETVVHLISRHEFGGDAAQNAIMDADSVSYFETNAEHFVTHRVKDDGYQKVKEKIDWMFNRISSEEHKKFARENYEKWSNLLEKYNTPA